MIDEKARVQFLRRIMVLFLAAVLLICAAFIVLVLVFSTTRITSTIRDELRDHETQSRISRDQLKTFVAEEHVATRKQIARFQKRIAQLEDFIIKQGLTPPKNGFVSSKAVPAPTAPAAPNPAEGPKPPPPQAPPHPTPVTPGPPIPPGPPINPPVPTPFPTGTCVDLPPPLEDFCV